ncbi:MAG: hypothetical protein AB1547_02985 [Thermodesulfobacteriota bacterium]
MLHYSKPFFPFWRFARSYELGLLSFSAAKQNSPAFLRVNPDGLTFCGAIMDDEVAKSQEVSVESRGDWGTFFAAAKKLSRPIS